jgi:hypothetical protein
MIRHFQYILDFRAERFAKSCFCVKKRLNELAHQVLGSMRTLALLAQLVERATLNRVVVGSSPT